RIALLWLRGLDDVQMVDVIVARPLVRKRQRSDVLQTLGVPGRPLAPPGVPIVDVPQLGAQDSGLKIVEAAVVARAVTRPLVRPMVPEFPHHSVNVLLIGDHGSAVAETAQVFLDDEAGAYGVAQLADAEPVAAGADGLRVIFDYEKFVPV